MTVVQQLVCAGRDRSSDSVVSTALIATVAALYATVGFGSTLATAPTPEDLVQLQEDALRHSPLSTVEPGTYTYMYGPRCRT